MKYYTLLSGETIDLTQLSSEEQEHISVVEKLAASSQNYLAVYRSAFDPLVEGKAYDDKNLQELHRSSCYKVVFDLVTRHHRRLFPR